MPSHMDVHSRTLLCQWMRLSDVEQIREGALGRSAHLLTGAVEGSSHLFLILPGIV